ncbi:MAG: bile acid:sodium symporter family protein [Bacilli bacterium]
MTQVIIITSRHFYENIAKISSFLGQTALFVIAAAGLAFFHPTLFLWVKGDVQTAILGFIMLTMGMTLSAKTFEILAETSRRYFYWSMRPIYSNAAIGLWARAFFNLPKGIAVGLLLVGTCPGGVSSNIMSYLAKGDVALSVGMTTASTLLAPLMTPMLMLWLSGEIVEVDAAGMFKSILIVTILPVLGGALMNLFFGKNPSYLEAMKAMPAFSVAGLALIVAGVTAYHGQHFLTSGIAIVLAIALHNALGYLTGYMVGIATRMNKAQRRTISIEVGCQNAGLGTNLASTHFQALPEAALATAVACVYHSISGTILANIFSMCDSIKLKKTIARRNRFGKCGRSELEN